LLAIIAAIAAVGTAVYLIYAYWDEIGAWFAGLWRQIVDFADGAFRALVQLFLSFTPLGLLMRAFMPALAWLRGLDFASIGRNMIQGLINGLTGMLGALKSTVISAASSVANWFKSKLGIHSPSRVFMGLGNHVMAGLDQGLAAGTSAPLARITDLSGRMTRALAIGAGSAAVAVSAPAAAQGAAAAGPATAPAAISYTINIQVKGGTGAEDIAEEVRKAIEKIERDRRGRTFGDE
jgi:hypothetical protein